jgi:hypothetical protein
LGGGELSGTAQSGVVKELRSGSLV